LMHAPFDTRQLLQERFDHGPWDAAVPDH
jgi:hypothetical protein